MECDNMNRFDRSDRNVRQSQDGFWKRAPQRWSGQEHYHLSHPDHYHHHGKSDLSRWVLLWLQLHFRPLRMELTVLSPSWFCLEFRLGMVCNCYNNCSFLSWALFSSFIADLQIAFTSITRTYKLCYDFVGARVLTWALMKINFVYNF